MKRKIKSPTLGPIIPKSGSEGRLFAVNVIDGKKRKCMIYTQDKMDAKAIRDDLIDNGIQACVSRGPDHIGVHGNGRKPWKRD